MHLEILSVASNAWLLSYFRDKRHRARQGDLASNNDGHVSHDLSSTQAYLSMCVAYSKSKREREREREWEEGDSGDGGVVGGRGCDKLSVHKKGEL